MKSMNGMLQKALGITSDGKCIRHPGVTILDEDCSALLECDLCWNEQHEHSGLITTQASKTATLDTANNNSGSLAASSTAVVAPPEDLQDAALPPTRLRKVVSTSTTAAVASSCKPPDSSMMMESVMARWKQMQQVGLNDDADEEDDKHNDDAESHKDQLSLLMEATNEEDATLKNDNSFHSSKHSQNAIDKHPTTTASDRSSATKIGLKEESSSLDDNHVAIQYIQKLEQRMEQQEAAIQQLQQTVERNHAAMETDIQHVLVAVTTMARHQGLTSNNSQLMSSWTTSNATPNNNNNNNTGTMSQPPPPPRPGMYKRHHPASCFTSARTMERKPPKPPVRHNSLSTVSRRGSFATAQSRRKSAESSHLSSSNVSSLGNSTTIHTASGASEVIVVSDGGATASDDVKSPPTPYYGPELESMLEQERRSKKHLDIIFDASAGNWSSRTSFVKNDEDEDKDGKDESNNDKDVDNSNNNEDKIRQITPVSAKIPLSSIDRKQKQQELIKTSGSICLDIPNGTASGPSTPSMTPTPRSPARSPVRSARISSRSSSPKRPERHPSLDDTSPMPTTNGASRRSKSPKQTTAVEISMETSDKIVSNSPLLVLPTMRLQYVSPSRKSKPPVQPPRQPSVLSTEDDILESRREIYAVQSSKQQISCLTLDPAISDRDDDRNAHGPIAYHDVACFEVTDRFGDKGSYTGTLKELDPDGSTASKWVNNNGKMLLPSGSGTMKYVEGRFYKGEWRDGHWHGRGLLRNANGDSYEGDFVYDARHGRGVYKYENGDVYEGDFSNDKRHGKGTFMFQNGSTYRGDFVGGNFEGYGWYEFDEGYYEGEWRLGQYEGIGTLQYTDGGSYTGRFLAGKAHGFGEERDAGGTIRRGEWENGELPVPS